MYLPNTLGESEQPEAPRFYDVFGNEIAAPPIDVRGQGLENAGGFDVYNASAEYWSTHVDLTAAAASSPEEINSFAAQALRTIDVPTNARVIATTEQIAPIQTSYTNESRIATFGPYAAPTPAPAPSYVAPLAPLATPAPAPAPAMIAAPAPMPLAPAAAPISAPPSVVTAPIIQSSAAPVPAAAAAAAPVAPIPDQTLPGGPIIRPPKPVEHAAPNSNRGLLLAALAALSLLQ